MTQFATIDAATAGQQDLRPGAVLCGRGAAPLGLLLLLICP
ncbi:hypothetical protein [Futiania mangrovi]|nr:hypothetical protein [Futiania mangrovii]